MNFPHVLLTPDDNSSGGDASTQAGENVPVASNGDSAGNGSGRSDNGGSEEPKDAFDVAADKAMLTVLSKSNSPADKDDQTTDNETGDNKDEQGEVQSLNSTEGELNEDGSPKEVGDSVSDDDKDKDEEKTEDEDEKVTEEDADKAKVVVPTKNGIDKPGDEKLPFHKHPRWNEVLAERDTARTELAQTKTQYDQDKPFADNQRGIQTFCQTNNISTQDFQELLQVRALMNTDPEQALAKILPIVDSLKAIAGKGIAPDLIAKVKDGVMDEATAQEMTKLRAQATHRQIIQQQQVETQNRQVAQQMEQSVQSWFQTKKTADPAFESKVDLINGQFAVLVQQTPPKSPVEVTSLLEKAFVAVNKTLTKFQPTPKAKKAPPVSNASRGQSKPPETMDAFADAAIEKILSAGSRR